MVAFIPNLSIQRKWTMYLLKCEHFIQKSVRKMHLSLMMFRKQGVLNNQMLRLGCCLPPHQNFWLRAWLIPISPRCWTIYRSFEIILNMGTVHWIRLQIQCSVQIHCFKKHSDHCKLCFKKYVTA